MSYKDLLLSLASYPDTTPPAAVDLAADFSAAIGAKLSAIACEIRISVPGSFIAPAFNVPAIADAEAKKGREQAEAALAAFQKAAENKGVFEERILGKCHAPEHSGLLVEYARLRDLTIVPAESNEFADQPTAEALIFESGRPVLMIPREPRKSFALNTATVAWDFSRQAARAVGDALPLLTKAKRVHIVTVTNEKRIDTRRSGPELAKHLARHGVDVILETVDAAGRNIHDALEAATRAHDSDLLVMGAYGHSRWREFVLGGATRGMVNRPPLPVLLSH
ncbi:universal stress protein [Bradyrhizobium sp.]|uniref:universal stress protein n=1 Tax=Bradyrhizobium sp. TaxID=376 RepID=UPI001D678EE2|nr:universal stress protein [Bradyrhizobium sp.]MBI5320465.1 universal stress protein [Bradyrhizobium sp.]